MRVQSCPEDTYSDAMRPISNAASCTPCPPGAVSPEGTRSAADCICSQNVSITLPRSLFQVKDDIDIAVSVTQCNGTAVPNEVCAQPACHGGACMQLTCSRACMEGHILYMRACIKTLLPGRLLPRHARVYCSTGLLARAATICSQQPHWPDVRRNN